MTTLTTAEMIYFARTWLSSQTKSTPRDILQQLFDYSVVLLGVENPVNPPTVVGEANLTTEQLLIYANKWLDEAGNLSPKDFLIQVKEGSLVFLQQLPKWRCSMFFKGSNGKVDSSLNFASIDVSETHSHRIYTCDAIRRIGGDTILFIAEKLYNNPSLQGEVDGALNYALSIGMKRLIIDLKNDNNNFSMSNMESFIKQMAEHYAFADSDHVAFMSCLETNEILSVEKTRQMVMWCKKYAPLKRVIVGAQNIDFLKAIGHGAELWYEIQSDPFVLSQSIADSYLADLRKLLPYGFVWAGEFWDGSSKISKYISEEAVKMGCVGVGSWVG